MRLVNHRDRSPRAAPGYLVALWIAGGCGGNVFACLDDQGCDDGEAAGSCEPNGFCSFPDAACDSGRRYGDHAGDGLAGECVDVDGTTSSSSSGAVTVSTTITSLESTTSVTTTGTTDDSSSPTLDEASSTGAPACVAGWWDCAWTSRMGISIGAVMPAPLAGPTPLMVRLTPERWNSASAQALGEDLRFVDAAGVVLPHEIDQAGATTVVWIRWPGPETDVVTMYYGNPDAVDGQQPAAVWQDGHEAVWHLNDGTDSLGAHPLAAQGTEPGSGFVGGAQTFDGVSSYMQGEAGDSMATLLAGPATIEAWVRPHSFGGAGRGRIVDNASDFEPSDGWTFQIRDNNPVASFQLEVGHLVTEEGWVSDSVLTLDQWHYLVVVFEDNAAALYVGGVPVTTTLRPGTGELTLDSDAAITIGRVSGMGFGWFDGEIDEVRLSSVARDGGWIATQRAAAADALLVYGEVETLPP